MRAKHFRLRGGFQYRPLYRKGEEQGYPDLPVPAREQ